jgi:hypothetical protein
MPDVAELADAKTSNISSQDVKVNDNRINKIYFFIGVDNLQCNFI